MNRNENVRTHGVGAGHTLGVREFFVAGACHDDVDAFILREVFFGRHRDLQVADFLLIKNAVDRSAGAGVVAAVSRIETDHEVLGARWKHSRKQAEKKGDGESCGREADAR